MRKVIATASVSLDGVIMAVYDRIHWTGIDELLVADHRR